VFMHGSVWRVGARAAFGKLADLFARPGVQFFLWVRS
jgi:hypothetical protein